MKSTLNISWLVTSNGKDSVNASNPILSFTKIGHKWIKDYGGLHRALAYRGLLLPAKRVICNALITERKERVSQVLPLRFSGLERVKEISGEEQLCLVNATD